MRSLIPLSRADEKAVTVKRTEGEAMDPTPVWPRLGPNPLGVSAGALFSYSSKERNLDN